MKVKQTKFGEQKRAYGDQDIPNGYVLAKDSDFEMALDTGFPSFGQWKYIGKDDKVAIPHIIQGKEVTSYRSMFYESSVTGVYSDNLKITDMSWMFMCSKSTTLDLTYLDTSNVVNMRGMFALSQATSLDLSNFNTANAIHMDNMFSHSQVTMLDLSSFDTRRVMSMSNMFYGSKAAIVYTRTKKDADKFNISNYKPSKLAFAVKPQTNSYERSSLTCIAFQKNGKPY